MEEKKNHGEDNARRKHWSSKPRTRKRSAQHTPPQTRAGVAQQEHQRKKAKLINASTTKERGATPKSNKLTTTSTRPLRTSAVPLSPKRVETAKIPHSKASLAKLIRKYQDLAASRVAQALAQLAESQARAAHHKSESRQFRNELRQLRTCQGLQVSLAQCAASTLQGELDMERTARAAAEAARDAEFQINANMGNEVNRVVAEMEVLRDELEPIKELASRGPTRVGGLERKLLRLNLPSIEGARESHDAFHNNQEKTARELQDVRSTLARIELERDVARQKWQGQGQVITALREDLKRVTIHCHQIKTETAESRQTVLDMEAERDELKHQLEKSKAILTALRNTVLIKTESTE